MANQERQIRVAAERILTASRDSNIVNLMTRTPDIIYSDDLIAGARINGEMSHVRRFFCLFVTFDFLFTCLMWFICTVITGQNIDKAFQEQIVDYNIETSLFDVVVVAFGRFLLLLFFYGLLYVSHWSILALSASLTCAFLTAKIFLFDWSQPSQGFQVLLIIASFVLSWVEIWFFVRVSSQEELSRLWFLGSADAERAPLLRPNFLHAAQHSENIHNYYTPMDSPDHSDREEEIQSRSDKIFGKLPENRVN